MSRINLATIKEKLEELDKRLPVRETLLLPSDVFFCREIPLPEGTLPAEVLSYVQLQVEAIAPFPIENLAWGFVMGTDSVLIYAATEDRAESFALNGFKNLWNAYPAFLPFVLSVKPATEDHIRICIAAGSASALFFKAGRMLPGKILSARLPEGTALTSNEGLLAARQIAVEMLQLGDATNLDDGVITLDTLNDLNDNKITFHTRLLHCDNKEEKTVAALEGEPRWNADVRGREYALAASATRRKSLIVWRAFAAACIVAGLLFVMTLALFAVKITGTVYRSIVAHHTAEVELLQNESDFATNLESVSERTMKPFSMLAVANAKRPAGLFYEKVTADNWNVLKLEGGALRSELIQGYVEELGHEASVKNVRVVRTATTGGNSTFEIEVTFNPLEDATTSK